MKIFCAQHRENHHLTNTQTEQLLYGLSAHLCDEETSPTDNFTSEDPTQHINEFCLLTELNLCLDGEGYREHVLGMQEIRRGTEKAIWRAKGTECPVCAQWRCDACGWRRNRASRTFPQHCHRCGSTTGTFQPIYHSDRATREEEASHWRAVEVSGHLLKKDGTVGKLATDDRWRTYSRPGVLGSLEHMPAALQEALAQVLPAFQKGILPA